MDAYRRCFPFSEMEKYRYGGLDPEIRKRIFEHLNVEQCAYCRERFLVLQPNLTEIHAPVELSDAAKRISENFKPIACLQGPCLKPLFLRKGQIWKTRACVLDHNGKPGVTVPISPPVIVMDSGETRKLDFTNIIRVIPTLLPTNKDAEAPLGSVFLPDSNPLKIPVLAEVFNECSMLAANLDRYLGTLSIDAYAAVIDCRKRWLEAGNTLTLVPEVSRWMEREREATAHLRYSVDSLVNDTIIESSADRTDCMEVCGMAIRRMPLAASDERNRIELPFEAMTLYTSEKAILGILQDRSEIRLRLFIDGAPPDRVYVDGKPYSFERHDHPDGAYHQLRLGYVEQMPVSMEIRLILDGEERVFTPEFYGG
ncbi:MAG: hypothetical protein AB1547_05905 [Thermodesulfobacteriota bacterium]